MFAGSMMSKSTSVMRPIPAFASCSTTGLPRAPAPNTTTCFACREDTCGNWSRPTVQSGSTRSTSNGWSPGRDRTRRPLYGRAAGRTVGGPPGSAKANAASRERNRAIRCSRDRCRRMLWSRNRRKSGALSRALKIRSRASVFRGHVAGTKGWEMGISAMMTRRCGVALRPSDLVSLCTNGLSRSPATMSPTPSRSKPPRTCARGGAGSTVQTARVVSSLVARRAT